MRVLRLAALALALCGAAHAADPKVIRINVGTEPKSLDPSLMQSIPESNCAIGLFDPLVRLDKDCNPLPAGATAWKHNDTYTEWTFTLRKESAWTTGEPVTAKDYIYGIERTTTPSTASTYAANVYAFIKGGKDFYEGGGLDKGLKLAGLNAPDDYTLVIAMEAPTPFLLSLVSHASWLPQHKGAIEKGGAQWATNPATFVGNGPFILTEFRSKDRLTMKKNPAYWNKDAIFWEGVEIFMIEEQATENAAFSTGDIDVTDKVLLAELDKWKAGPEYRPYPMLGTYYIGFNCQRPPFDNVAVRKAFSKALRRQLITDRVTRRGELPATGMVPSYVPSARGGGKSFRDIAGDLVGPQDAEGAKKLLAEAGFGAAKPLPGVEYLYNTAEEHKIVGEQMQSMWKRALGANVRLQNVEFGVKLTKTQKGDYDIARLGWIADYMDAMTFLELFTSDNPQNDPQMRNKDFDALIHQARMETDPVKREDLLIAAERILLDVECAVAPLYFYSEPKLVNASIENLHRNALGQLLYPMARRK